MAAKDVQNQNCGSWEISCLVHILILRYCMLKNSMLLGVNDILDGICNLRFRILGGNCNFYPEATWKRGFIKSFSRIHLRRRFVWSIWGYHPAHDRVGKFVSAILYHVLHRLFVYFLPFENITATYGHTRNSHFHITHTSSYSKSANFVGWDQWSFRFCR